MQWRVAAPHPSRTPSPPNLRLPNLPILLPASCAPHPRYLLCTLRAPRRRHRVALDCECHVRSPAARALDPLAPAARTGGGGAAPPAAASRLFPGLFRSAFPSPGPASTNLSKILRFRSARARGRDPSEEGALCVQQVALNSRPARPLLEGTPVSDCTVAGAIWLVYRQFDDVFQHYNRGRKAQGSLVRCGTREEDAHNVRLPS